jgi:hypothetical protein
MGLHQRFQLKDCGQSAKDRPNTVKKNITCFPQNPAMRWTGTDVHHSLDIGGAFSKIVVNVLVLALLYCGNQNYTNSHHCTLCGGKIRCPTQRKNTSVLNRLQVACKDSEVHVQSMQSTYNCSATHIWSALHPMYLLNPCLPKCGLDSSIFPCHVPTDAP